MFKLMLEAVTGLQIGFQAVEIKLVLGEHNWLCSVQVVQQDTAVSLLQSCRWCEYDETLW